MLIAQLIKELQVIEQKDPGQTINALLPGVKTPTNEYPTQVFRTRSIDCDQGEYCIVIEEV